MLTGFKAALADPLRAVILVLAPSVLAAPALYLAHNAPSLALQLSPEIVVPIQVFQELMHWPAMVFLMGGLAAVFVRRKSV